MQELRSIIRRHARAGTTTRTALPGVTVIAAERPTRTEGAIAEPTLAVVVGGTKHTIFGERVVRYAAGQYLLVTLDLPVTGSASEASREDPFLAFGLTLRPAAIAALLMEAPSVPAPRTPAGIGVADAGPGLLDAGLRLLRLLDHPQDAAALAPLYEREILWRLVTGEHGAMVRQIGLADSALSSISRAASWIRTHHAQTLRVEDLARLSGMSPSSFHRHFRAATGTTPLGYQKQVRLQEARARLIAAPENVAGIGFAVGYNSPSQFSREYTRAFGMPPGRDAERLRGAA